MATSDALPARYAGVCAVTGRSYPVGAHIERSKYGWILSDDMSHTALEAADQATIYLSVGEGYGGQPYTIGQVLRVSWTPQSSSTASSDAPATPPADDASTATTSSEVNNVVVVLACGAYYYSQDGMSFGVGDEQGHVYWASCRLATMEEATPILTAEEAQQKHKQARLQLEELFNQVRREGIFDPASAETAGRDWPEGDEIAFDERSALYGGGHWLILDKAHGTIWALQGNSADGDTWSQNNFRGAMGWHKAADPTILASACTAAAAREGQRSEEKSHYPSGVLPVKSCGSSGVLLRA